MVRPEWLIVGCIAALVGIGLCVVGYEKMQPTTTDKAVSFVEKWVGEKAPAELKSSKREGYTFLGLGGLAIVVGLGMILGSRRALPQSDDVH